MDNLLLQACVRELEAAAVGLPFHRLVPEGPERMMLLLGTGWGENSGERCRVHLDLGAALPGLHRTRRRARPAAAPTPFQGLLARDLEGTALLAMDKPAWDRRVSLRFGTQGGRVRELVAELLGPRPNLLLLDGGGLVLGHLRPGAGARRIVVGRPPPPLPPPPGMTPDALDPARWRELLRPAGAGLARRLRRSISGMSPALWEAVERSAADPERAWELFRTWREAAVAGRFEPTLYAAAGEEVHAGEVPPVVAPYPCPAPAGTVERRFADAGEALDALLARHDKLREIRGRRDSLAAEVRREEARLGRLESRLAADLAREDEAEELSRRATALLAGLAVAERRGDEARVPDPARADGQRLRIPIDPRLSLQANAERLFHRARKARRGRQTVARRLGEVRRRLPALREASCLLEAAGTLDDVLRLEERLSAAGVLRLVRRQRPRRSPAPAGGAPEVLPIRSFVSADGMEILLGRTGAENDRLTFRVAAPHDFWLHAQGFAGAHVVVRNPERLKRLPRPTLEQAAQLAAFHSKARGSGRVEVMVAQRRQVRRGRNLPPGAVRVKRHESVQVAPEMPFREEV